ncbi:MAG: bifunctional hydroxymethylpyrimidine kinase/phosphomethylpyrimidine kinase [Myxococcota bacterium]
MRWGNEHVFPVEAAFVGRQIDTVMKDIRAEVWVVGYMLQPETIGCVVERANHFSVPVVVLDPVMQTHAGQTLLEPDAIEALKLQLLPRCFMITPNLDEAELLLQTEVRSLEQMKEAARAIYRMGSRYVLLKGGRRRDRRASVDIFYDGGAFFELHAERVHTHNTLGLGMTMASVVAAELAWSAHPLDAAKLAKRYITQILLHAEDIVLGNGRGLLDHFLGQRPRIPEE